MIGARSALHGARRQQIAGRAVLFGWQVVQAGAGAAQSAAVACKVLKAATAAANDRIPHISRRIASPRVFQNVIEFS